jgi:hypothetical protein
MINKLRLTVSGLAMVAIFTINVDAENLTLINHKCVCGALNRHFCQTRVTCWPSVHRVILCRVCRAVCRCIFNFFEALGYFFKNNFVCVGKASSFAIFSLCVGLCELQMCVLLAWAF